MAVYREFNSEELWREYNIEATVPSIEPFRDQNITLTEEMKRDLTCYTDLAFLIWRQPIFFSTAVIGAWAAKTAPASWPNA